MLAIRFSAAACCAGRDAFDAAEVDGQRRVVRAGDGRLVMVGSRSVGVAVVVVGAVVVGAGGFAPVVVRRGGRRHAGDAEDESRSAGQRRDGSSSTSAEAGTHHRDEAAQHRHRRQDGRQGVGSRRCLRLLEPIDEPDAGGLGQHPPAQQAAVADHAEGDEPPDGVVRARVRPSRAGTPPRR